MLTGQLLVEKTVKHSIFYRMHVAKHVLILLFRFIAVYDILIFHFCIYAYQKMLIMCWSFHLKMLSLGEFF